MQSLFDVGKCFFILEKVRNHWNEKLMIQGKVSFDWNG